MNKKIYTLDNRKSIITKEEIEKFKKQAINTSPNMTKVSDASTEELIKIGIEHQKQDGFHFPDMTDMDNQKESEPELDL